MARLAGLPAGVIERAHELLANMEKGEFDEGGMPRIAQHEGVGQAAGAQMALFTQHPMIDNLREVDLTTVTPLEALNLLHRWKQSI